MMIYNHGLLRAVPFVALGSHWIVVLVNVVCAMLPDLYSLPETAKGNYSNLYKTAHSHWIFWVLSPDHLLIDKITHDENGWTDLGKALNEFTTWTLGIYLQYKLNLIEKIIGVIYEIL
jgi:hypothetical protein